MKGDILGQNLKRNKIWVNKDKIIFPQENALLKGVILAWIHEKQKTRSFSVIYFTGE